MNHFIIRLVSTALSLGLMQALVKGIHIDSLLTLFISAFILNVMVTFVRPVITFLTLPFTILTMGLFLLVVNGVTLALTALIMPGFTIDSFGSAIIGWIVLFFTSMFVNSFTDRDKKRK